MFKYNIFIDFRVRRAYRGTRQGGNHGLWEDAMAYSSEIRRLTKKWESQSGWPKRLDWLKLSGLRGWNGQQFKVNYPIMALVGENGSGKSTVIQCAAAVYRSTAPKHFLKGRGFASDYFPNTTWDPVKGVEITYSVKEKEQQFQDTIKRLAKWRGNKKRRERPVINIDLSRIQPVPARTGYSRIAKLPHKEVSAIAFDKERLGRFSQIMNRDYQVTKMALTNIDNHRTVPVVGYRGTQYSGFHMGAGETVMAEFLQQDWPKTSLVLIDEMETSLHPRAQRRLIRDLAERCRELDLQIILTTHSPFILQELPPQARAYIMETDQGREIIYGASTKFEMTKMDDVPQYQCDVYVEDRRSQTMLTEILVHHAPPEIVLSCLVTTCGAASVGQALGIMVDQQRFHRPTCVFLDGDQPLSIGCLSLPGDDAPERVVFSQLKTNDWFEVYRRLGRPHPAVVDSCSQAMLLQNEHEWVDNAAIKLTLGGDILWQALCAEWAEKCASKEDAKKIVQAVEDCIGDIPLTTPKLPIAMRASTTPTDAIGNWLLFEQ